ncbi:MAG: hypothetical protein Rubg2KO_17600 [Rubricoccaceae bacterium]
MSLLNSPPVSVSRLALGVLAILFVLAGCGDTSSTDAEVHDLRLRVEGQGLPMLTGYVVNTSDRQIPSADVFVTLYDDERPMEDVQVLVQRIPPGDSVRFEKYLDVRPTRARLKLLATN